MVHTKEAVLMLDTPSESGESCVLGSTILRSQIVRIQFCSKMPLEVCQGEMWDVSAAQDRSILAWAKKVFIYSKLLYELYKASDTKIKLQNARGLFWGYENLCEINLDKWIDSSSVSDMSYMFCVCLNLTSLDLSSFDTSNVTYMRWMFKCCSSLTQLDLSNFDTSKVTKMYEMFNSCSKLTTIYVSNKWNVDNVTESEEMFTDCINLPNYNSYKTKKTNAHYGKGGYLTLKK